MRRNNRHDWRWNRCVRKQLMRSIGVGQRVLGRQETLSRGTVSFSLGILFERVRNGNRSIAEVLSVHGIHGRVRRLEAGKVDESKALRIARLRITHNLWRLQNHSERRERVVQQLLVHFRVQISDEDVRTHVQILLMGRSLVNADRLAVQLDHVHNLDRVIGVLLAEELHEPVTLVHLRDSVLGHVHVHDGTGLDKHLPQQRLRDLVVEPTHVNGGIWKAGKKRKQMFEGVLG